MVNEGFYPLFYYIYDMEKITKIPLAVWFCLLLVVPGILAVQSDHVMTDYIWIRGTFLRWLSAISAGFLLCMTNFKNDYELYNHSRKRINHTFNIIFRIVFLLLFSWGFRCNPYLYFFTAAFTFAVLFDPLMGVYTLKRGFFYHGETALWDRFVNWVGPKLFFVFEVLCLILISIIWLF